MWRPSENGPQYFVKPMEIDESFSDFIDCLRDQQKSEGPIDQAEKVKYSQAREQN